MGVTYKTNSSVTSKSMTEWYFGKAFVSRMTEVAQRILESTGETTHKFWQDGTGYLTIKFD